MKTTIELPDITFRRAKAFAAVHGITMRRFITDAIEQQLRRRAVAVRTDDTTYAPHGDPPWMAGFGDLSDPGDEHRLGPSVTITDASALRAVRTPAVPVNQSDRQPCGRVVWRIDERRVDLVSAARRTRRPRARRHPSPAARAPTPSRRRSNAGGAHRVHGDKPVLPAVDRARQRCRHARLVHFPILHAFVALCPRRAAFRRRGTANDAPTGRARFARRPCRDRSRRSAASRSQARDVWPPAT